ncbi:aldehyde dehydrogenase family protein [Mycetocola manganoxydans]|uniref:L-glutamate gamma-semialdehyde dehydrogenase n=1 Tax=Mycetocola manganoxydans TaxID=699879 RepID=A0A3L6ZU54_9MICO|nr:bifunctional proline dehydrogenase/L-glutamate gamma-semialdehyde dehydrogenase [Mycetocola manganoxydans]RLP71516.1 aldehyde dehydrogenase family protein [Mycetocola manganoxydans]
MPHTSAGADLSATQLATDAVSLARKWVDESAGATVDPAAQRLAEVLKDPNGLAFTVGFVDGVMRPEDLFVAGYNLQRVAKLTPAFLPWYLRAAITAGGILGPVMPWVVIPVARKVLRGMVGHLVVDATPAKLGPAIEHLRQEGSRLNLNLLGEAVLGDAEAAKRLHGTRNLLARDDVDYVSIKVSSIVSQLSMWAFDDAVDRVVERLTPLYELAASSPTEKFINLDMEEYRDLDLTVAAFMRILDQPQLKGLEAGIVLQAYLPDALAAMQTLQDWAAERVASGGAPIKVRLVKGANLAMEGVDAAIHDWPTAPYDSKQDTDANYKRVLMWALTPERTRNVRVGVAGHNLFDLAFAWLLAQARGVTDGVEFEMLLGMATGQADAVKRDVGNLLLYTPVVNPKEFDVAISYLIRRLEENASQENFMSAVFELHENTALFEREKKRFLASVSQLEATPHEIPSPRRTQNRETEWTLATADELVQRAPSAEPFTKPEGDELGMTQQVLGLARGSKQESPFDTVRVFDTTTLNTVPATDLGAPGFVNTRDTDPSLPANRAWATRILARVPGSELGNRTIAECTVPDAATLDFIIGGVRDRGATWGGLPAADRAAVLEKAALSLAANRDRLIEVMASETGKTIAEADPEVSEAIDFAHYYAAKARELDAVRGARFVPSKLTVVTPPWNFPVAIPAGGVLAALAAGSGVILKPAHQARRCAAVLAEALWEAGVPQELLTLVALDERELGKQLVSHPDVDRVILTGAWETADLFRSWRPDLPLLAETSGKNAIIVTPSADLDLAAADVVKSAFGHAGQKCSAASLVILVGSVARSERFHRQLVDAATSLRVGYPEDATSLMGPIIEPADGKLKHALTELGVGEKWLVKPKQLDDTGRLWSPGIRADVAPGSYFHLTEFFGPVLGVMHAANLAEAIRFTNAIDYGLTSGLHTQDPDELAEWLTTVEAGNLYVNRGITGAIVQRQPFGGWKRSAVGAGAKAGGPNYLLTLGSWLPDAGSSSKTLHLRGLDSSVTRLIEAAQPSLGYEEFDVLRRSALSDAIAWGNEYGETKDASGIPVERNLFRYRPVPVAIRASADADLGEVLRVALAALRARSPFTLSVASGLPAPVRGLLGDLSVPVFVETDGEWVSRTARGETPRVRIVGPEDSRVALHRALAEEARGNPDLAIYSGAVTQSGRIELLPFLHEQAISITAHRFGNLDPWSAEVI